MSTVGEERERESGEADLVDHAGEGAGAVASPREPEHAYCPSFFTILPLI